MATLTVLCALSIAHLILPGGNCDEGPHSSVDNSTMNGNKTFKYFAFGSNLLSKRIHINNPTAVRYDIGLLNGYRLDFGYWSKRWNGYAATIVPTANGKVWGAIWDIGLENLDDLDRQEGVSLNVYKPVEVEVKTIKGETFKCRSYCLVQQPEAPTTPGVPNLLPSKIYLNTMVAGAKESKLPESYVKMLEAIPDNGYDGAVNHVEN